MGASAHRAEAHTTRRDGAWAPLWHADLCYKEDLREQVESLLVHFFLLPRFRVSSIDDRGSAPAALTDNRGTELNGVIPLTSPAAPHLERHAKGVKPAGGGVLHVDYRFIILLIGAVARLDGAPLGPCHWPPCPSPPGRRGTVCCI